MKIAFLSGAYKNSGDFLIEKRGIEIIKYVYPKCDIVRILRKDIQQYISEINDCDVTIIGGGPIFQPTLEKYMPLDFFIQKVKIPTIILGGGWYGDTGSSYEMGNYTFDKGTNAFFRKVYETGLGFSCRDIHTINILKRNGFSDAIMTGCPAWYDTRFINDIAFRSRDTDIKNIVVSDPAKIYNLEEAKAVLNYLRDKFPNANIKFLFHRGIQSDSFTSGKTGQKLKIFTRFLEQSGIEFKDISFGADGFSEYDNCDLHIGYRVHAHIYNLSIRNKSILIEEDGRGAGVNQALGLPAIRAYDDSKVITNKRINRILRTTGKMSNQCLINELDTYLDVLMHSKYSYIKNAFSLQRDFFAYMKEYVERIETIL